MRLTDRAWTEIEIEYLKLNFKNEKIKDIAVKLKRTSKAVSLKIFSLKLNPLIRKYKIEINNRYGRLLVIEKSNDLKKFGSYFWICKCDCGKLTKN